MMNETGNYPGQAWLWLYTPGSRSIPRWTRIYRIIWRRHYRGLAAKGTDAGPSPPITAHT
jgi:hypothetical protein